MLRSLLLVVCTATSAAAADLNVRVHGGLPSTGQVLVTVFMGEKDWMKNPQMETVAPIDGAGEASLAFRNLEPGHYGISIIYDEDSDGELDLNLLGIPSEGFGFSNNARASFGPPKWNRVRFQVKEPSTSIDIRLDRAD